EPWKDCHSPQASDGGAGTRSYPRPSKESPFTPQAERRARTLKRELRSNSIYAVCPFACELRIEQSPTIQHGAGDVEEPVNDRAQGAGMAVTFGPEGVVFGPTRGIALDRVLPPVISGVC